MHCFPTGNAPSWMLQSTILNILWRKWFLLHPDPYIFLVHYLTFLKELPSAHSASHPHVGTFTLLRIGMFRQESGLCRKTEDSQNLPLLPASVSMPELGLKPLFYSKLFQRSIRCFANCLYTDHPDSPCTQPL